jgi:hypothetical protein
MVMKYILEFKSFYKEDDIVFIEYWYNDMETPVKILQKLGNKYLVTHNIEQSKIKNAPDELISKKDIISHWRL